MLGEPTPTDADPNGSEAERTLDGQQVPEINANLTVGIDLTKARRLRENVGIAYQGPVKVGSFEVDDATARRMLLAPNPDGRSNSDVIRPWVNGLGIARRPRGMWIIDFGEMPMSEAALYEVPFEHVKQHVMPMRLRGRRAGRAERWWLHGETVPALRRATHGLNRYICRTRVAKHRIFASVASPTLRDSRLMVFAREDDYSFGVLHSRLHEAWTRGTGSQLREVESGFAYTPTTCFETFPFPHSTDAQREAIAAVARELDRLREGWLNPPGLSDVELKSRTLTNLYNARPTWLAQAHQRLDAAVLDAYGWPAGLADDEILTRLLELNLEREQA
jgi:hypothetical protein